MRQTIDLNIEGTGEIDFAPLLLPKELTYQQKLVRVVLLAKMLDAWETTGWQEHTCDWDVEYIVHTTHGEYTFQSIHLECYFRDALFHEKKNDNVVLECYDENDGIEFIPIKNITQIHVEVT